MWPWKTKEEAVKDLDGLHGAYQSCFTGPVGEEALHGIASYSEAFSGYRPRDPYEQAFLEGKRAVFWHIWEYAKFSGEELFRLKARKLEEPTNG